MIYQITTITGGVTMYLFKFKNCTMLVEAETKLDAILCLEVNYSNLFKNEDFEILKVDFVIDENGKIK